MKTRSAFYKVRWNDPVGMFIGCYTWLFNPGKKMYSHVEQGIYVDDELLKYIWNNQTEDNKFHIPDSTGWWYFSSTTRSRNDVDKKSNGTRWIKGDKLFKHPGRWDVYEYKVAREPEQLVKYFNSCLFKKYDWLGLLGFAGLQFLNRKNKDYCSEVCWAGVKGKWKKTISPLRMYRRLKRQYNLSLCVMY